jgi:hypothetical protein
MVSSAIIWEEEEKLDYRLDLPWELTLKKFIGISF